MAKEPALDAAPAGQNSESRARRAWKQFRRNRLAVVGLVIITLLWELPCWPNTQLHTIHTKWTC